MSWELRLISFGTVAMPSRKSYSYHPTSEPSRVHVPDGDAAEIPCHVSRFGNIGGSKYILAFTVGAACSYFAACGTERNMGQPVRDICATVPLFASPRGYLGMQLNDVEYCKWSLRPPCARS